MKKILLLFLFSVFLFGCIQLPGGISEDVVKNATNAANPDKLNNKIVDIASSEEKCEPSYSVSIPAKGKLGDYGAVSVKADCAEGKTISVYYDGSKIEEKAISQKNEELLFNIPFTSDGKIRIEVAADNAPIKSQDVSVAAIGNNDTSDSNHDAFSSKEYIASGFETKASIGIKSVGLYVKKLYSNTLKNSYAIVEIRKDNNGVPASSPLALSYVPIEKLSMNPRWIWFNFNNTVSLSPGRYWVVLRVDQEEPNIVSDVGNIHYVAKDTETPAGPFVKKMELEYNTKKQKYEETEWEPVAYDRVYTILISAQSH